MGDQNVYPGPVDNSGLLRGKTGDVLPPWTFSHHQLYIVCLYAIPQIPEQYSFIILEVATKSSEERGTKNIVD